MRKTNIAEDIIMSWVTAVGSGIVNTAKAGQFLIKHSKQATSIIDACGTIIDKLLGVTGNNAIREDITEIQSGMSKLADCYELELKELKDRSKALEDKNKELEEHNKELEGKNKELSNDNCELKLKNESLVNANKTLKKDLQDYKEKTRKKLILVSFFSGIGIIAAILLSIFL